MTTTLEETFTLEEILDEIKYCEKSTLRKRFEKLSKLLRIDLEKFKNDKNEYVFTEAEKDWIRICLEEMEYPFLVKLCSHKTVGKNMKEIMKNTEEFRERMLKQANMLAYQDSRDLLLIFIEEICGHQLKLVGEQIAIKLEKIESYINGLPYNERVQILTKVDKKLDDWIDTEIKDHEAE